MSSESSIIETVGRFWGTCDFCKMSVLYLIKRERGEDWVRKDLMLEVSDPRHLEGKCEEANQEQQNVVNMIDGGKLFFCTTHQHYSAYGNCLEGKRKDESCTMRVVE